MRACCAAQVSRSQQTLLLSEVAARKDEYLRTAKAGDVVAGKVALLTDFGAFVDIIHEDGELHGVEVGPWVQGSRLAGTSCRAPPADWRRSLCTTRMAGCTASGRGCCVQKQGLQASARRV